MTELPAFNVQTWQDVKKQYQALLGRLAINKVAKRVTEVET